MLFGYDWDDKKIPITLKDGYNLDDIRFSGVTVLSGDEVLDIHYNDYECQRIDCGQGRRIRDYYDGSYVVEPADIPKWLERKSSYDYKFWN